MPATKTQAAPPSHRGRRLLINLLILLAVFIGVQWYKSRPLASGEAPALRAALSTSEPFDLKQWRGHPVLVHFWAVWCPICKLEQESIDELSREFKVVTIAMQSGSEADINTYLREQGLSFAAIADPYGEIATAWGVRGVPASFVVDGGGRIRFASVGYSTGLGLRGRLWAADKLD